MKTINLNSIFSLYISVVILLTAGCDKPYSTVPSGEESHNIGAKPFKGETYRSLDNPHAITIVSPDELELHENGTNLICKYTKQDGRLRVVANIMGTAQALYYDVSPMGVSGKDGMTLYTSENYQRITTANREISQRKAKEQASLDAQIAISKKQSSELAKSTWQGFGFSMDTVITDTSIVAIETMSGGKPNRNEVFFVDLEVVNNVSRYGNGGGYLFLVSGKEASAQIFNESEIGCVKLRETLLKAYREWKQKFPALGHAVSK